MAREVFALKTLDNPGIPKVLDDNTSSWEDDLVKLFVVMEWVEGPTLNEMLSGQPLGIDDSLSVSFSLALIIQECHDAGIIHRDIKPDNIILRNRKLADPVLVDFGLARSEGAEDKIIFKTGEGEDLSSRFFRMPEAVPGIHATDPRSDVTLLVAVLFYMITGVAPRQPEDSKGLLPHEALANKIPKAVLDDKRWPRLSRVFRIGLQVSIDRRFQSVAQFESALRMVGERVPEGNRDSLAQESDRVTELLASTRVKQRDEIRESMSEAHETFKKQFRLPTGLIMGGSGPSSSELGRRVETHFYVHRKGDPDIRAVYDIITETDGTNISASYRVDSGPFEQYYWGAAVDRESLVEAAERAGTECCAKVLASFRSKFSSQVNQRSLADVFR